MIMLDAPIDAPYACFSKPLKTLFVIIRLATIDAAYVAIAAIAIFAPIPI
jgi:hypothetical protein